MSSEESNTPTKNENLQDLSPTFNFALNHRILPLCAVSAKVVPDEKETLIAVTVSNKVILKDSESSLHIPDKIKCITTVPFGNGYDYIVVGTESQIIVYDFYYNSTVFQREVPDGINCFAVSKFGEFDRIIICGGNCAIWGFDETGKDIYWTVTGDVVNTMCLCDYDGDGELELIVGSPDSEIRVFKNDLMRVELLETDSVVVLQGMNKNRFAYALINGTVGVYQKNQRLWRIKSKNIVTALLSFPTEDMLTCVWNSGKIDIRSSVDNGEITSREMTMSGQQVVAGFLSKMSDKQTQEVTIVLADGRVQCYELTQKRDTVDKNQETLRLFGQKKHNLLMELNNFEHEEHLSEAEKEKDHRIPIGTTVDCKLFVAKSDHVLYLVLEASNNVCIRGVIAFAEGVFEGESFIWIPHLFDGNGDRVQIPIAMERDMPNEMHIRTFLGPQESNKLSVFETVLSIPRFARFCLLKPEDDFTMSTSFVEFILKMRNQRILDWVIDNFLVDVDLSIDQEQDEIEIRFGGLASNKHIGLYIRHTQSDGKMKIHHDSIETVSNIVQSICDYFALETLESQANFPEIFAEVEEISNELDSMYDVRDRLTTDLSEKQYLLKEVLVRAEDALVIDNLSLIRKYYTRLRHMDRSMRQAFFLRSNNHERFVQSLRRLNKIIEHMARLRCGEPSRQIVSACRDAILEDNKSIIVKLLEYGA